MSELPSKPPFLERLKRSVLIADGAMGTMVSQLLPRPVECIEQLCLTQPDLIADLHRQYVRAGANIVETNTFAANRIALSRYRLENQIREINVAAVRLARTEAGKDVYVAGSLGPYLFSQTDTPEWSPDDIAGSVLEQADALMEEGVDLLILETFVDIDQLTDMVRLLKKHAELPLIASLIANRFGCASAGKGLLASARQLLETGADIVGLNCGDGIRGMGTALECLAGLGAPLCVMPNAGFPERVGGRLVFGASEEYFANEAVSFAQQGARIIGGCCGTTPAHIQAMAGKLRENRMVIRQRTRHEITSGSSDEGFRRGKLLDRFASVSFPVLCEIDPPALLKNDGKIRNAIQASVEAGADAISMADNPLATIKVENLAYAAHLRKNISIPVILHITGRDRNLLGLQSYMLGAHLLEIEALLCVTGDPSSQHGGPANVFDVNSLGLVKMAAHLNKGKNLMDKDLGVRTDFSVGVAVNPNLNDFSPQIRHLKNKIQAGARFAMTQPMFDVKKIRSFVTAVKENGIPVFVGIMPLLSLRTAEYLHHEVPGISIPQNLRDLLGKKDDAEYQRQAGLEHAHALIDEITPLIDGLYLIAPHSQPGVLADLVRLAKGKRPKL